MTDRLYYIDPYLREFDARVVRVARGDRTLVTLDRTAFYPTSGGQPFDLGTLGSWRVVDVFDSEEDGSIGHVVDNADAAGSIPQVGDTVHGVIDWARRFEHMQQHTGQHVLSAAFQRVAGVETLSFHLGAETSTIDLAREVPAKGIAAAEDEANRIVWEDRPVTISFATPEEAVKLPIRKEPVRGGTVRLIDVKDCDLSACGGTHVSRTGSIGIIATTSWERFKGGQRIEFVCGVRAMRRFRAMRDAASAAGRLLSVGGDDLPSSIERLQAEGKEQKRTLAGLQTELLRYRAEELSASAEQTPAGKVVLRAIDADAQGLKALALAIAARPGHVAVLTSTTRPALAVVARSVGAAVHSNEVLASLISKFGGRGGGKPDIAQGGGLDGSSNDILAAAKDLISA